MAGFIDNKPSKSYYSPMKKVDITLKAHKQIAKLSRQDLPEIYAAFESLVHWPEISGVKALVGKTGYRLRIGLFSKCPATLSLSRR